VPLAPWEPYYCYNHWGPSSIVVNNINITNIYIGKHKHHYDKHAVVVKQGHFYTVNNYKNVRIKNTNNNVEFGRYQRIPVISDRVIKNLQDIKQRHNFTATPVGYKPHHSAEERIKYNQARQIEKEPGNKMLKRTAKMQRGEPVSENAVRIPEVANKPFSARRDDATRRQELFKQGTPDRGVSEPVPREKSKVLTKKTTVPRMTLPDGESEQIKQGRDRISEVTSPRPPKEGRVRIDQPEKPVKMKEGRHRPQPPQSAVLTQPDGHNQPAETPPAVSRPIPPRTKKKMDIGQPGTPVEREEGSRVTN